MSENKLSTRYDVLEDEGYISKEIPSLILDNINPMFDLRKYQKSAIGRLIRYCESDPKKNLPIQLLFNMATGSGKTLIMVASMLYLYEKGYRNFVFFVDKKNIIRKTIDNFLNKESSKYLFANNIFIDGQEVLVRKVESFSEARDNAINIYFSTISGLHTTLNQPKENSVTYDDFAKGKTVFISDEAHHINALTKNKLSADEKKEKNSWEYTVNKLVDTHIDNVLLEFTATIDWEDPQVLNKYKDRVLLEYDLKKFREDKFSKDVFLFQSDSELEDRMLQAVIVSQYRRKVASKNKIPLKPVILMKSKTIKESQENLLKFIALISKLKIADIRRNAKIVKGVEDKDNILGRAFEFFDREEIEEANLIEELKVEFSKDRLLEVNSDEESEQKQLLINDLENPNNQIRVVFAVDKLNEGWDVLNLFDIVRLYGTRDSGKPTMQEAQLVGRGARYFPFELDKPEEKYVRKFDDGLENEMRVLEQLHFYSIQNHRYISELRASLQKMGIHRESGSEIDLKVKDSFKDTRFYKQGFIFKNERIINKRENVKALSDVVNMSEAYKIKIDSASEVSVIAGFGDEKIKPERSEKPVSQKISELPIHIVRKALDRIPFFYFENLKRYFPEIESIDGFITNKKYLGGLTLEITTSKKDVSSAELFRKLIPVLEMLKNNIKANSSDFEGTKKFIPLKVREVVKEKRMIIEKPKDGSNQERGIAMSGDKTRIGLNLSAEDWYVFDDDYGTDEEKYLVKFIFDIIEKLKDSFKEIHLIRNQKIMELYSFNDGLRFEPDYLLFLGDGKQKANYLQLFIEPKGGHIEEGDKWKEEFLLEINKEEEAMNLFEDDKYRIFGLPFYQEKTKEKFKEALKEVIKTEI